MSNETEAHELLPCPFCGAKAQLFGGPMAHEPYSVWCVASSRHNMVCGGFNKSIAVNAWNTRPYLSGAKDKRIAELEAKLAKAVEVLIVYENKLVSFATATDDTADEAEVFLDRDRGKLARNVLAELKGETE